MDKKWLSFGVLYKQSFQFYWRNDQTYRFLQQKITSITWKSELKGKNADPDQ